MTISQFYDTIGGNFNEVKSRLTSEKTVRKFVLKYADDKTFEALENSLKDNDLKSAFRAAHTLKGICLNLGFSDFFKVTNELTEYLRPLDDSIEREQIENLFSQMKNKYKILINTISQIDRD